MKRISIKILTVAFVLALVTLSVPHVFGQKTDVPYPQIQHIVIQFNENQSFDHFMGDYCKTSTRPTPCNVDPNTGQPFDPAAPVTVSLTGGGTQAVTPFVGPDISPTISHGIADIANATQNQWLNIRQCTASKGYACFGYLTANMVPNAAAVADAGTISDATYTDNPVPSWNSHIGFVTAGQLYGFTGANPGSGFKNGWGCDSGKTADWQASPGAPIQRVPTCFPDTVDSSIPGYGGAFEPTPVQPNVPTLMQDLDAHGISWKMYGSSKISDSGYAWSICPTFASCLYTGEHSHLVPLDQFFTDAASGNLPQVAFVLPGPTKKVRGNISQHNGYSVMIGENFSNNVYNALFGGPNGSSSVFEKTWDDCGCFYDHKTPTPVINGQGTGIRVPAIFAGNSVKVGYTDSTPATFTSTMAMIEWLTGIPPIGDGTLPDSTAYNYSNVFSFGSQSKKASAFKPLPTYPISQSEYQQLQNTPEDTDDPT